MAFQIRGFTRFLLKIYSHFFNDFSKMEVEFGYSFIVPIELFLVRLFLLANYGDDLQSVMLDKLKTYKHFAVQNEMAEENYIRHLVQTILPFLLPKNALVSKYVLALLIALIVHLQC